MQYSAPGSLVPEGLFQVAQVTRDEKHPGPPYVSGGPFHSVLYDKGTFMVEGQGTYYSKDPQFVSGFGVVPIRFVGGFYNPDFSGSVLPDSSFTNLASILADPTISPSLEPYYPAAARMRPKIEQAGLGQAIAEIRDIPRTLKTTLRGFRDLWRSIGGDRDHPFMSPKRAADEFLNLNFGWGPMVKDVSDAIRVTRDYNEYVTDLMNRNNRWDHKSWIFEESETPWTVSKGSGWKIQPTSVANTAFCFLDSAGNVGSWEIQVRTKKRVWGTGDFKFYRPEFDSSLVDFDSNWNRVQRAMTLYGARVNPELLYKITPYTWLFDYVTNAGSVVSQMQAAATDGVVSKNLYLMCSRVNELVFTQTCNFHSGTRAFAWRRKISSKQRDHAGSPFGFGLSPFSLSGRQYAVLAALGLQARG